MPGSEEEILVEGIAIDVPLKDGDEISLGDITIKAMVTKGHTDCSMSYAFEPMKLLFASESTGLLEGKDYVHTPFLKDCNDAIESRERCKAYGPEYMSLPHFGMLPKDFIDKYWEMLEEATESKKAFIKSMADEGLNPDEMLERYTEKYWDPEMEDIQPMDAFIINSKAIIKAFMKAI